jgi:hypothetical protein
MSIQPDASSPLSAYAIKSVDEFADWLWIATCANGSPFN